MIVNLFIPFYPNFDAESTLNQGVKLLIKYLLITSFYQAGQRIKTRDFHNLIGRAGRSGIHTEKRHLYGS